MRGVLLYFFFLPLCVCSQTEVFRELNKWGIKENGNIVLAPVYDTVFNFDVSGKVCMACIKAKPATTRFIKLTGPAFHCSYLNRKGERLVIKQNNGDTTGAFSMNKECIKQYQEDPKYIIAPVKNFRYLADKNFNQLTQKDYTDIAFSANPELIIVSVTNEGNQVLKGLINLNEQEIIPINYSGVKLNMRDSLLIACSAGLGHHREDDIFDFTGKKISGYKRHVDMATKKFVIHKVFEPDEHYIIYNTEKKEEKTVYSEGMDLHEGDNLLMHNEGHWFLYDMQTGKKKPYEQKKNKK